MKGLRNTWQPDLFMSLKRDMAMVSGIFYFVLILCTLLSSCFNRVLISFRAQVTQQIFVVEEWAKKARDDLHREAQSRSAAEKTAGDLK